MAATIKFLFQADLRPRWDGGSIWSLVLNFGLAGASTQAHNCFVAAIIRIVLSGTVALAIIVAVIYFGYFP